MVANPMVSVVMITYNHELFIEESLLSILNQETSFEYEVIVGNDHSTDKTDSIVQSIIETHPKGYRVNYYNNNPNLGVTTNSKKALDMVRGKYMALCEGDDFWIDNQKLQKQVDFLEQNDDFAICFHNTRVDYFDKKVPSYYVNENIEKDVFTLDDMIGEDEIWFTATASLMIRSAAYGKTPDWLLTSKSGDIPIIILAARRGKIKYLPDVMAVYRKNLASYSHTDSHEDKLFLWNRIFMYNKLNEETGFKFNDRFKRNIARYYFMLLNSKQYKNRYFKNFPIIFKYIQLTFPNIPNLKLVLRDHLIPPLVMDSIRKVKKAFGLIPSE
ncbi:glycosyltransferase family 2 protein [Arcticibacterium luteifluviistationis]|uniref:Glycosyl transferase family 2 n=1 Tax=Arcticibacterium luteifluviistationis TaxID=1784714 RepID=A0A2Z4GFD2_9BACT|nr:glycosyltransferase [Arcticibacterium luteifluviistationis]AWV99871.1 glycosyl transferase family 2 [Arcticibacterium luteifluviistationis]